MGATIHLLYEAAKVRLGFLITACALAGVAVSPSDFPGAGQMLLLAAATLLASSSAGLFNQIYEADLDRQMARTSERPFAQGRLRPGLAWYLSVSVSLLVAVAAAGTLIDPLTGLFLFLGAFTYGVVYTVWLKRRSWLNIVIGGAAGSFAVLAGAAAVGAELAPAPLILAVVLFLWTPPHFWALAMACRDDYAAAAVPMLPVIASERAATRAIFAHVLSLVLLSLLPFWLQAGWIYLAGALAGGSWFLLESLRLVLHPAPARAWRVFAASILQLGLLLTAAIMDRLLSV